MDSDKYSHRGTTCYDDIGDSHEEITAPSSTHPFHSYSWGEQTFGAWYFSLELGNFGKKEDLSKERPDEVSFW
jgi:hypothetical protein